jgi:uncharacterized membrane protein YgcG
VSAFYFLLVLLRRAAFATFAKTSASFFLLLVPVSLVTARGGRPAASGNNGGGGGASSSSSSCGGEFLISRDLLDSSHGIALPEFAGSSSSKRLNEARLRNATRWKAKRATDALAFVLVRVSVSGMFLMPMFSSRSKSGSSNDSVGYFGALYAFVLSMGSLGLTRAWTTWNWSVRSNARKVLAPLFAGYGDRIVQSSRILSWLEKSRNQFGASKDSMLREKVVSANARNNALEKLRLAALTFPKFHDDLHFQLSRTGQRKRYFRVKRIAFDVATDPSVVLYSAKMVVVAFVAQMCLSWFRLAPSASLFSLVSKFVPGYVVYVAFKICRDVCESILNEPYAFRPDTRASGTERTALEPLMRAMRGEFVSEYAFSQVLAFDDCLKIASGDDFEHGRLPLLYSGSDAMASAAFGLVAPGRRRYASADANADEAGGDEDEDGEKTPDFLDVLSIKRAFLACALAPATAVARAMRDFHEKAIMADARSSAGPPSAVSMSGGGGGGVAGGDGFNGVGGSIGGMLSLEAIQMRKHRHSQASIASKRAAQAVEDYGALADLGVEIAAAMFSNVDEFGDEMLNANASVDRRNHADALGEHERPTFRDVAIATCAYREAVKCVREVTFPDSALTMTASSAAQHLQRDAADTGAPQTTTKTTTALDGTDSEPIIRPSSTPFQTGWTTASSRGRNENVSFWSSLGSETRSSAASSLYSSYPALSQLPVAEAARIHESFANSVVSKLALLSQNGALFARPGSRLPFLEKAMNKPASPPILGQFKSRRFSSRLLFERDEDNDDDDDKEDVDKEDLRCSYFGDIDAHEKVLAGAVSAFTQAA